MKEPLEESERSLSTLIKNVPGVVYRCRYDTSDETCTMKYLSERCKELTGYDPSDLINDRKLSWGDLIHEEDREKVHKDVKESVFGDEPFKITYRIITKEGELKWVWEQGRVLTGPEGEIKALEGFISDITEKVEAQQRLEEREKKVKELYEATTKMERCRSRQEVFDLALQSAKEILRFYASGIFMREDDYFVGKRFTEKSVGERGDRYPIDEGIKGLTFDNEEGVLIKNVDNWDNVVPHQEGLKSGVSVPIGDRGIFQAVSRERGDYDEFDLEMAKILASHINETIERIETEKEKSLILDTAEEHILYLDTDLSIKWANQETKDFANIEKNEKLKGKKCYKALRDAEEPMDNCPVRRAMDSGEQEEEIIKYGEKYWLLRASPRTDEDGEVAGVVEMALDITERKVAEEKLRENKEKIEKILDATSRMEKKFDHDEIYKIGINAAENILDIQTCGVYISQGDELVLKAESSGVPDHRLERRNKDDEIAGETWQTKEPDITHDFENHEDIEPLSGGYRSGITVPLGDIGIFQAMSKEKGYFDEEDLTMLELLTMHMSEAIERVNLYQELKESEKRYRDLFEKSPISVWEEDFSQVKEYLEDLKESGVEDFEAYFSENPSELEKCISLIEVKDVNQETLDVFGAENKDELKQGLNQIFREETYEILKEELSALAEDRSTFETKEIVNYTLKGKKKYFYMKWTALGRKEKDYSEVIISLVDITDLKETQEKLRKSEKRYRSIFEQTGTAMVIIDEDKTISLANEEFAKLSGYSIEQIEDNIKWTKFVAEEDREKMREYHRKRREEDERAPTHYEFKLVNRFGDVRDIVVEVGIIPESNKSVASLVDITDYKKTFGAMRESQEAFRTLFENEQIPIAIIDKEKELKEINDSLCQLLNLEEGDFTGKPFKKLVHPDDREDCKEMIEDMLSGEIDSAEKEIKGLTGDGKKISLKIRCDLVRDHDDNPLYIISTYQKV